MNPIKYLCLFFLLFSVFSGRGQDSIPLTEARDSARIDTIIIRSEQFRVAIVPRGVNLTVPRISFKTTKPLLKRKKRFRIPSFWEKENTLDIQMSEVAFVNWNAGGDNAVSALAKLFFKRNYQFRHFQWANDLELRFGWNAQEGRKWRKADDAIKFSSTIGYRRDTLTSWYYSVKANFNTQFADGFKYPNREQPISRFMAPGYVFIGAGTSYIPEGKDFNLYLSPLTFKGTFVLDQELANRGAFGVERAVLNAEGNVLEPGKRSFTEMGILITNQWKTEVMKNVMMNHNLSLYTDYLRSFGNIDVNWELGFDFKVNDFLSASLKMHMIYDDDILFDREEADDGTVLFAGVPKIQFRQQLGIGINYNF